jgi:hypothetical protein
MSRDLLAQILIVLLMGAGGFACTVEADYHRTRYRCDGDNACPSDQACLKGYCESLTAGNLPRESGCGTTNLLRDDFEEPERNRTLWRSPAQYYATASQDDGQLVMDLGIEAVNSHARYLSRRRYLFRSSSVAVEIARFEPGTGTMVKLELDVDGANQVSIRLRGASLQGVAYIQDQEHLLFDVPYFEPEHRWLRLRESNGVMYWETSGDGSRWEIQISTSSAPFSTMVLVELEARMYERQEEPVQIRLDNLNTTLEIEEGWCATSSFSDDFNDGLIGPLWEKWRQNGCDLFERDGRMVFVFDPEYPGNCGYSTRSLYDMTESSISVEVPSSAARGISTNLSVWTDTDEYMDLKQEEGQIRCFANTGSGFVQACAISYDPVAHRWWRLRHGGSLLYWETSPDGTIWDEAAKHERGEMPIHEVSIGLWSQSREVEDGIENVENGFDNFNLAGR